MQLSLLLRSRICAVCCRVCHIPILGTTHIPSYYTHTERISVVIAENGFWRIRTPPPPPTHGADFDEKYAIVCLRVLHM
jgi:hypothetical protein